ncbi:hypothetical protein [Metallibacterium scheffleri]|uniref:hypothetical protein n=1 Tax=Metallibacterium scheffleri TaxID=993689 RepID=UPI0009C0B7B1|nr:hypothetical protein [Metallibacterium scheffleri]
MSGAKHHPAERKQPARRHGTRAGQGLPPPPTSIDGALDRISDRVRLGALRAAFHKQATAAVFRTLSPAGQRACLAALSFCTDEEAVVELVQAEVLREIDPRRAAECLRVARGRGLEYDHSSPEHRARVACGWARRAHKARAQAAAREAMIASGEAYDQEADE